MTPGELVDTRALLEGKSKAASAALDKIDAVLGTLLRDKDRTSDRINGEHYSATITAGRAARGVDAEMVARVAPPAVFMDYVPPARMTMKAFDEMLKDGRLDVDQVKSSDLRVPAARCSPRSRPQGLSDEQLCTVRRTGGTGKQVQSDRHSRRSRARPPGVPAPVGAGRHRPPP